MRTPTDTTTRKFSSSQSRRSTGEMPVRTQKTAYHKASPCCRRLLRISAWICTVAVVMFSSKRSLSRSRQRGGCFLRLFERQAENRFVVQFPAQQERDSSGDDSRQQPRV